jgi:ribosomal protein S18 acetylase RimI-like enzyme
MDKNIISLEHASVADFEQLYGWFNNLRDIQSWGGPELDYPLSSEVFINKLKIDQSCDYKLVDNQHNMQAFGQSYQRLGRKHFARLAVSPSQRGKGIGRLLLQHLMRETPQDIKGRGFSLFVMKDNQVAINLYQSMGFRFETYPEFESGGLADYLYMTAEPK